MHSAGVGTLLFAPELKGGKLGHQVLLSRVLHVPELSSNLSVLYLVRNHQFQVHISAEHMEFERDGPVYMIAPIDTTNTAYLAGEVVPVVESAQVSAASTLPLDPSLWHRRFTHFHNAGIQSIITGNLVTGMRLDAKTPPDPICEPCLHGKLNAAPFPSSTSRAAYLFSSSTQMSMALCLARLLAWSTGPPVWMTTLVSTVLPP